ncbi:MAG: S41 family peptidase [Planctomycetota bacterium]
MHGFARGYFVMGSFIAAESVRWMSSPVRIAHQILVVALFLTGIASSRAAEPATAAPVIRKTWGVVVGIESYKHLSLPPRKFARADAAAFHRLLISPEKVGAAADSVWLLTDHPDPNSGSRLATADNVRAVLKNIAQQAKVNDLLILYLQGAGLPSNNEFRWLGCDTQLDRLPQTTILSDEWGELLGDIPCHWTLCYADLAFEQPAAALGFKEAIQQAAWQNPLAGFVGNNRFVFSADDARNPSPEDPKVRHGLFTGLLLRGFDGAADREGEEADGWITAGELWKYLQMEMPKRAAELGITGNVQPVRFGNQPLPSLRLAPNPAAKGRLLGIVMQLAHLRDQGKLDSSLYDEGVLLLEAMPVSAPERRLRTAYAELAAGKMDMNSFSALREQVLKERALSPESARVFADAVMEARDLIDRNYVRPKRGNQAVAAGIRGLYLDLAVPIPGTIEAKLREVDQLGPEELHGLLIQARMNLGPWEESETTNPLELCLHAMFQSLDPYSRFLPSRSLVEEKKQVDGHFAGLGIQVRYNDMVRALDVVTPIFGAPAFKAGIRAGDRILAIDGRALAELSQEQAFRMLNGRRGQVAKLVVLKEGAQNPITVEIPFADVKVTTVVGYRRNQDYSWNYWYDESRRIAYVRLTGFDSHTAEDLRTVLSQLAKKRNVGGLILDLRFNGGGLLKSAIDVAGCFVKDLIVTIVSRGGNEDARRGRELFRFDDFPLVVLVNEGSASGAEIVAGAIADNHRGILVGERSFGKGSVQDILDLDDLGGAVRLTTASFYRPNGKNVNRGPAASSSDEWGVSPEDGNIVPMFREESRALQRNLRWREIIGREAPSSGPAVPDPQLQRAVEILTDMRETSRRAG